jgi:hypothetical protein
VTKQDDAVTAGAVRFVSYPEDGRFGDAVRLMKALDFAKSCGEDALLVQIAENLPSLGRCLTATWLLREVFGRELADVCRSIIEEEREKARREEAREAERKKLTEIMMARTSRA